MSLKGEIKERVDAYLYSEYEITKANVIPDKKSIAFGAKAKEMFARILFIDIRGSRKILSETDDPLESCRAHKAFLYAASKCIRNEDGQIRSFSGDSIIAFFMGDGDESAKRAVRAAMKIKYAMQEIINPMLEDKDQAELDFGIGIAQGTFTVVKSGMAGDEMYQDLIWICWATYYAVECGDKAQTPYNIWISERVFNAIKSDKSLRYNSKGDTMWSYDDVKLSFGTHKIYKTSYRWIIK